MFQANKFQTAGTPSNLEQADSRARADSCVQGLNWPPALTLCGRTDTPMTGLTKAKNCQQNNSQGRTGTDNGQVFKNKRELGDKRTEELDDQNILRKLPLVALDKQ